MILSALSSAVLVAVCSPAMSIPDVSPAAADVSVFWDSKSNSSEDSNPPNFFAAFPAALIFSLTPAEAASAACIPEATLSAFFPVNFSVKALNTFASCTSFPINVLITLIAGVNTLISP